MREKKEICFGKYEFGNVLQSLCCSQCKDVVDCKKETIKKEKTK